MSYLDVPRIHFAGRFSASPSTLNNSPANFGRPIDELYKSGLGWNPDGTHWWRLEGCTVRSAVGTDGRVLDAPGEDIVGAAVVSTDRPHIAKLVDLDPEQQMVSQIWGLRVRVEAAGGDFVEGAFRAEPFTDLWFSRGQTGEMFAPASARYQSILEDVSWGAPLASPLLQQLQAASPGRLSINFVVDSYEGQSEREEFTYGRVVGTIGPAADDEPPNFVLGRLLSPLAPGVNYASARIDGARSRAFVDLGNSLSVTGPFGPYADLGELQLAEVPPAPAPPRLLGPVGDVAYERNAGVYELPLTPEQLARLADTPLGVVQVGAGGAASVLLAENSQGAYLNASPYVHRLNPGDPPAEVTLYATAFGEPKAGQKINVSGRTFSNLPITGTPRPLKFRTSVRTDARGRARLTLTPGDPGRPRGVLDGQVYKVSFSWDAPPPDYAPPPRAFLSVLVFSGYEVKEAPTWADVEPIFGDYAKMYPFMKETVDLSDLPTVQQYLDRIALVMSYPPTDPRYMPVTRDLSENKRRTILRWLQNGAPR